MARQRDRVLHHLRQAALGRGGPTDGQLLRRYLEGDGPAFEALVRRHGPMVLGVCRRVLGHEQDAEDAFQATFLALAQKATRVRKQTSVKSWLYGVATHIALTMRRSAQRRRARESQVPQPPSDEARTPDDTSRGAASSMTAALLSAACSRRLLPPP